MGSGGKGAENGRVRKRARANSMGPQWWRKLSLPRRGKKDTLLSPRELEEAQKGKLKRRREKLRKAITAPRSACIKHMAVADWDAQRSMACIVQQRGNAMQSMGVFTDGKQWLYPEEALFLVDKGCLDLRMQGMPISFQHAWALTFGCENALSLEEYLVFVHLRRAGYVVRRVSELVEQGPNLLKVSLSAWRVGAFRRKDVSRPLFHVAVFQYEDCPPNISHLTALLQTTAKTRVKIALIDRGVVVLTDVASNATPLSDRFRKRLIKTSEDDALREGEVEGRHVQEKPASTELCE